MTHFHICEIEYIRMRFILDQCLNLIAILGAMWEHANYGLCGRKVDGPALLDTKWLHLPDICE